MLSGPKLKIFQMFVMLYETANPEIYAYFHRKPFPLHLTYLTSSSFLLMAEPMLEKAAVAFRLAWDSVSDVLR